MHGTINIKPYACSLQELDVCGRLVISSEISQNLCKIKVHFLRVEIKWGS